MKSKWDISKIETKATTFGTGSHIITPATWNNKVIVAMLKSKWDEISKGVEEK